MSWLYVPNKQKYKQVISLFYMARNIKRRYFSYCDVHFDSHLTW